MKWPSLCYLRISYTEMYGFWHVFTAIIGIFMGRWANSLTRVRIMQSSPTHTHTYTHTRTMRDRQADGQVAYKNNIPFCFRVSLLLT